MDRRRFDNPEQFRRAHESLANARRPIVQRSTAPAGLGSWAVAVVVVASFAALAYAYGVRAQRQDEPVGPAFVSDTSAMVRIDGSRPATGHLFMTAVRNPRPAARASTARGAMETSQRNAVRAALGCVDPSRRRDVSIDAGRITGPSGGLMFALTILDTLEPLDVRGQIAGTGTISPSGVVGPIGDIGLKARAARDAHADVFLAPKAQAALAKRAAPGLRVAGVNTLDEAVRMLGRAEGCNRATGKEIR